MPSHPSRMRQVTQKSDGYMRRKSVGNRSEIGQISNGFATGAARLRIRYAYRLMNRFHVQTGDRAGRAIRRTFLRQRPCGPLGAQRPFPIPSVSPTPARPSPAARPAGALSCRGRTDSHHRTSPLHRTSRLTSPCRCRREEGRTPASCAGRRSDRRTACVAVCDERPGALTGRARQREGFDRAPTRWHHASRCNNGKEVIPCLTLRWRVAPVRRTRLRSRPPGSPDAAGNINPSKPAQPPGRVSRAAVPKGAAAHFS
jgi:hypothetical protein